jgi:ferredoxin
MLPDFSPEIGNKITKMPGVTVTVGDKCVGCGTCTDGSCFVDAIQVVNGRAIISDQCRGCGRCVEVCPENAITLSIDHTDYIEKSISRISNVVDVK